MSADWDLLPEDQAQLIGCHCGHEPEEHGWQHCDVDSCDCEGRWEE